MDYEALWLDLDLIVMLGWCSWKGAVGKNKEFLEPIKKLLGFGEMEPVVSVERPSVSQPVPDKVMSEMRSCGAAIIHVDAEQRLLDSSANEHIVLNPNVLIEIGAAMALYGRRFILLVRDGVKLPSNLQGLYEVRYSGDSLSGDVTIRLLEAINDIKNHAAPDRYSSPAQRLAFSCEVLRERSDRGPRQLQRPSWTAVALHFGSSRSIVHDVPASPTFRNPSDSYSRRAGLPGATLRLRAGYACCPARSISERSS